VDLKNEAEYQIRIYDCLIALEKNPKHLEHWKEMRERWLKKKLQK
jgi:hypothetical protein